MNRLQAGDTPHDFTLADQTGKPYQLSQAQGKKVLVYFYPKAMTPGCTTQACALRDSKSELAAFNVEVIGISPDSSERLARFADKQGLNFTLLADEDHRVASAFGVWGLKKFMGREFDGIHRISFLLNEHGVIEKVFDKFKTKDHHQVVLNYLSQS